MARTHISLLLFAVVTFQGSTGRSVAQESTAPPPGTTPLPNTAADVNTQTALPQPPRGIIPTSDAPLDEPWVDPAEKIVQVFNDPPAGMRISKTGRIWVDRKSRQVIVDGYIALREGMLEMFACPAGTKEHESVVATLARSQEVHAALLAVGAQSGTPVQWSPRYVPATGQGIRIWVIWFDEQGNQHHADARTWVVQTGTKKTLQIDWVFAGSNFWTDPSDGTRFYEADSGDMICVSNFASAMLDLPVESTQQADSLLFSANTEKIPPKQTFVRLLLIPIPQLADQPEPLGPDVADPDKPPATKWLTLRDPSDS